VGDSITHSGWYVPYVYLYLATRYPGREITVMNAGISGDTAGGVLRRYDWDVAARKPTVATVMLGMNDVGRGLYPAGDVGAETRKRQAEAIAGYRRNLGEVVGRLKADGVEVILLTPSPYDDTAALPAENQPGCNDGLAKCAEIVREVAAEHGCAVVDFHGPMTALNLAGQKADPSFTLSGNDRVHPGSPGHLVMAALILRGLDVPTGVSRVAVDTVNPTAVQSRNAAVRDVRPRPAGVAFRVKAERLPFPTDGLPLVALRELPVELNREIVQVAGLSAGDYELAIEGKNVGVFSAAALASGVDLAGMETPQLAQSREVAELVRRWRERTDAGLRRIAQVEHFDFPTLPRPVAFAQTRPVVEEKLAGQKNPYSWPAIVLRTYLEEKPREQETAAEVAGLAAKIAATARPVEREYTLERRPENTEVTEATN
jgi:lysophospholipase L1-like esterase